MDFEGRKCQIMSAFHHVSFSTTVPKDGALILATVDEELIFWWRTYPTVVHKKLSSKQDKEEVVFWAKDIQKISINYKDPKHCSVLFTLESNLGMKQFDFRPEDRFELLHLIQLITVHKCQYRPEPPTLDAYIDFFTETMALNEGEDVFYDMDVDCGQVSIPLPFCTSGMLPKKLHVIQPELNIVSKYNIISDVYMKNPIKEGDLQLFQSLSELKEAVKIRGISPEIRHIVWPIIFDVIPFDENRREEVLKNRIEEYKAIKLQWTSLSKHQIKSWTPIKDAFGTIRVDVKRTHPPPGVQVTEKWSETLTSLLKSFTIWNRNIHYTQGLNDIAANIMIIFCPPTCNELEQDAAEALAFWCFANFVEMAGHGLVSENMMLMQEKELSETYKIIEANSANHSWLEATNMSNLSFLISPFMLAFGRSFDKPIIARIWECLVCVPDPWIFLKYFSASLVIFSLATFMNIPNCTSDKLVPLLDEIFPKLDIGNIIGVALAMMTADKGEMEFNPRGKTDPPDNICSQYYKLYAELYLFK